MPSDERYRQGLMCVGRCSMGPIVAFQLKRFS